jgi:hypothetical protein
MRARACTIKHYRLVMYRLDSKIVCFSELVKVTDKRKDTSSLHFISVHYESVMFDNTVTWSKFYNACGASSLSIFVS